VTALPMAETKQEGEVRGSRRGKESPQFRRQTPTTKGRKDEKGGKGVSRKKIHLKGTRRREGTSGKKEDGTSSRGVRDSCCGEK